MRVSFLTSATSSSLVSAGSYWKTKVICSSPLSRLKSPSASDVTSWSESRLSSSAQFDKDKQFAELQLLEDMLTHQCESSVHAGSPGLSFLHFAVCFL